MNVACISDLHGKLPAIPPCDLLLIAGDICPHVPPEPVYEGNRIVRRVRHPVGGIADVEFQSKWLGTTFRDWLDALPAAHIVATWGNHDWVAQRRPEIIPQLRWHILTDASVTVGGLKIWGSPWQPYFYDWAFNAPPGDEGESFLAQKYAAIPDDTDILLSHGPPLGYGDRTADGRETGSSALRTLLARRNFKLLVTGHIHEGYGTYRHPSGCPVINGSVLDEHYDHVNAPVILEL